jgi:hypothetical protein
MAERQRGLAQQSIGKTARQQRSKKTIFLKNF